MWDDYPDLLLWLLYIGGAFLPEGQSRSDYIELLRTNYVRRFRIVGSSWSAQVEVLKQYYWPVKAFGVQGKTLWKEAFP